jgi:hypothetical protein
MGSAWAADWIQKSAAPANQTDRHRDLKDMAHLHCRPSEASEWVGDVGRVETFFEPARLRDLERRVNLPLMDSRQATPWCTCVS